MFEAFLFNNPVFSGDYSILLSDFPGRYQLKQISFNNIFPALFLQSL